MHKEIVSIHCKADLDAIIYKNDLGILRKYLLVESPISKSDRIVKLAHEIENSSNATCILEAKLDIGRRAKRIEIVAKDKKQLRIFKITSQKSLDRDALDLDQSLTFINERYESSGLVFFATLVTDVMPSSTIVDSIKKSLLNQMEFIQYG
ncbi:hypothetical protein XMV242_000819 [Marinobacterium sp. xm-v-242]|nr:hypothetical protein [Marinobacterium sp. xm-v-242]NRP76941.1 hypothetical protein [Marinobacterium sp. xm-m-383]